MVKIDLTERELKNLVLYLANQMYDKEEGITDYEQVAEAFYKLKKESTQR